MAITEFTVEEQNSDPSKESKELEASPRNRLAAKRRF